MILGCTHYPILINTLKFVFNQLGHKNLNFVESGHAIASDFYCNYNHKLKFEKHSIILLKSEDEFYVTDTPYQFNNLANKFLGQEINNIQLIKL